MKKSIIAAGAASLALAAMPVVGAMAEAALVNTMTDTLNVTVPTSCSITNGNTDEDAAVANVTNTYAETINNGNYAEIGASNLTGGGDNSIEITCNASDASAGWRLTAVGAGSVSGKENKLVSGSNEIASGNHVTTGDTSNWDFKVTQTGNAATAANGFNFATWTAVPAANAEKDLATGTGSTAAGAFLMEYSVYVSGTQPGGTYTGAVKYTLYNPAS